MDAADIETVMGVFAEGLARPGLSTEGRRKILDALDAAGQLLLEERARHLIATMAGTRCCL